MDWHPDWDWVIATGLLGLLMPYAVALACMNASLRRYGHRAGIFAMEWRHDHWQTTTRSWFWQAILLAAVLTATAMVEACITCSFTHGADRTTLCTMVMRCSLISVFGTGWSLYQRH